MAKPAIIGLIGFADRLKSLWQAIRFDDPYADWWLLKVEDAVADTRVQLQGLQQRIDALITESTVLWNSLSHNRADHSASRYSLPTPMPSVLHSCWVSTTG